MFTATIKFIYKMIRLYRGDVAISVLAQHTMHILNKRHIKQRAWPLLYILIKQIFNKIFVLITQ